jgi:hypothetical protein
MSSLLATAPVAKSNTVEIKGALYAVEAIAPGECGVSAVRVVKLVNGESYDVIRTNDNVVECSCPDFVCRHEGNGTVCKHGAAMVARGFLPAAPAPGARRPVLAPVTPADVKRARYFGLTIPAPVEVEAPALHPQLAANLPRADPVVEALSSTAPIRFTPTRSAQFIPTPEQDAERLGYDLASSGEEASPPAGWEFPRLVAFYRGWLGGKAALEAETAGHHARPERVEANHPGRREGLHPTCLAEGGMASGCPSCEA